MKLQQKYILFKLIDKQGYIVRLQEVQDLKSLTDEME